jgi:hypothetical protein
MKFWKNWNSNSMLKNKEKCVNSGSWRIPIIIIFGEGGQYWGFNSEPNPW